MKAEIITIGDEILIGQIVDTNSVFIAKELNKIGIDVYQITSVQDEEKHILQALSAASKQVDVVIITGGLGPTNDDITKLTLCKYFNDSLTIDTEVLANVKALFKSLGKSISQLNKDQALLPTKATALHNKYGTAPGLYFDEGGVIYVSMPGVPFEMKALMKDEVIPRLKQRFKRPHIFHKTVLTYGMPESDLAEKIMPWEAALPSFIKLAYLPGFDRVKLRLSARGENALVLKENLQLQLEKLEKIIGDIIKGYEEDEDLQNLIAKQLTKQNKTITTAESCTGGKIAAELAAIPGASNFFKGGIVTYATITKTEVLGIPPAIIDEFSVVSAQITAEMAKRAKKLFNTDYAIATTGNAGPTKGDSDAEIGSVFISIAAPNRQETYAFNFGNGREKVTEKAVKKAMLLLLDDFLLEEEKQNK